MSPEKPLKQLTLFQEDSPANRSPLQAKEEALMMTATSGMKLLESCPFTNPDGLLAKMSRVLLTSKTVWSSDRCKMTWKKKVSKSNVLLFQLQASVLGTKGTESGLFPTPVVSDHLHNKSEQIDNWEKRAKQKKEQGINLHFALRHHVQMYPTPTTQEIEHPNMVLNDKGTRRMTKDGKDSHSLNLADTVKMWPTRNAWDGNRGPRSEKNLQEKNHMVNLITAVQTDQRKNEQEVGGTLNPMWVEWLMGYPLGWTDLKD